MGQIKSRISAVAVAIESWYFDLRHGVVTRFSPGTDMNADGNTRRNYSYLPTRPSIAARLLRDLPIHNHADYTFIDFGSGKGRMLLLASQFPYKAVHGIEMRSELHSRAIENIRRAKRIKRQCKNVLSFNIDAENYQIPDSNLVLYFFNPFAPEVMVRILSKVRDAIEGRDRNVLLILLYPEFRSVQSLMPQLRPVVESDRLCIYSTV